MPRLVHVAEEDTRSNHLSTGIYIAYNTDDGALIDVQASNVTISGFLLNGDNPGYYNRLYEQLNGEYIDAASGIVRYSTGDNLVVTNNIIQNLSYFGVTLYDYPAGVAFHGRHRQTTRFRIWVRMMHVRKLIIGVAVYYYIITNIPMFMIIV